MCCKKPSSGLLELLEIFLIEGTTKVVTTIEYLKVDEYHETCRGGPADSRKGLMMKVAHLPFFPTRLVKADFPEFSIRLGTTYSGHESRKPFQSSCHDSVLQNQIAPLQAEGHDPLEKPSRFLKQKSRSVRKNRR